MGYLHMADVYKIPSGWVTDRQLLLLLVLAEQTDDKRVRWFHDRTEIAERLNWSPSKLRRELAQLEGAQMIVRSRKGHRVWVDIGWVKHIAVGGPGDHITPTEGAIRAAARDAKVQSNLRAGESS